MFRQVRIPNNIKDYYKLLPNPLKGIIYGTSSGAIAGAFSGFGISTYCYLNGNNHYNSKLVCIKYSKTDKSVFIIPMATITGAVLGGFIGGAGLIFSPIAVPALLVIGPVYGINNC